MFNQSRMYVLLVCLSLASCTTNNIKFNPISYSKVSDGGIAFMENRTMFAIGSGAIHYLGDFVPIKPLAVSLIDGVAVKKNVKLLSGEEFPVSFFLSNSVLKVSVGELETNINLKDKGGNRIDYYNTNEPSGLFLWLKAHSTLDD